MAQNKEHLCTIDLYTRPRTQAEQLKPEPKDRDRCEVSLSLSHSWKSGGLFKRRRGGESRRKVGESVCACMAYVVYLEYFPIEFYIHNNF